MYNRKTSSYRLPTILAGLALLAYLGATLMRSISYEQDIGGHLKLAGDANTTQLATEQLKIAISGMDKHDLCNAGGECFTSVIYRTPDEDVAFWRMNIETTFDDLQAMSDEERADNLIESNTLIKVRETLMDSGQHGDTVTDPSGISLYPSNTLYAVWGWGSMCALFLFGFMVFHEEA